MYQFNYRGSRIAWGPLNKQMAAFRGFPGGLPPSARPFTSLIEFVFCSETVIAEQLVFPLYTVPLWGARGNSAIPFRAGDAPIYLSSLRSLYMTQDVLCIVYCDGHGTKILKPPGRSG